MSKPIVGLVVALVMTLGAATVTAAPLAPSSSTCQAEGDLIIEVCTPKLYAYAISHHLLAQRGPLHVQVVEQPAGNPYRSGDTVGLIQVIGNVPLQPGTHVVFTGHAGGPTEVGLLSERKDFVHRQVRIVSLFISAANFHMDGSRMVWLVVWPKSSKLPSLREIAPRKRSLKVTLLRRQILTFP